MNDLACLARATTAYSVNSILYQRGIYPPETFQKVNKYGLSMLLTTDQGLKDYLGNVFQQLAGASTVLRLSEPPFQRDACKRLCSHSAQSPARALG